MLLAVAAAAQAGSTTWQGFQWFDGQVGGLTIAQDPGTVTFGYPGVYAVNNTYPSAQYVTQCQLTGPFSVTVDYSLPTGVGSNSGIRAGIQIFDNLGYVITNYRWNTGYVSEVRNQNLNTTLFGVDQTSGSFRIVRTASGAVFSYRADATTGGASQQFTADGNAYTQPVWLLIGIWSGPPYTTNPQQGGAPHVSRATRTCRSRGHARTRSRIRPSASPHPPASPTERRTVRSARRRARGCR